MHRDLLVTAEFESEFVFFEMFVISNSVLINLNDRLRPETCQSIRKVKDPQ